MDSSKRPEKLSLLSLLVALGFVLFTSVLSGVWAKSYLIYFSLFPLSMAFLTSVIALWHAYLVRREAEETEERQRVSQEFDREDLFDDRDDSLKLAAAAHRQFHLWALSIFTLISGGGVIGIALWVHSYVIKLLSADRAAYLVEMLSRRNPLEAAGLGLFMALFTVLAGSYFNGVSREQGCRWLRPVAQWLLFSSFSFFIAMVVMFIELFTINHAAFEPTRNWDLYVTVFMLWLIVAFGIEMLVNFIIEFYRPRTRVEEDRPLYESRILALVTEPGGIAHNVAYALDYQFGFKVSETWFYRFLERSVVPFLLILGVAFYLLNCFTLIHHNERGIKLYFGKAEKTTYDPGLKFKWPWPINTFRLYPVKTVQKVDIGFEPFDKDNKASAPPPDSPMMGDPTGRVIVWEKKHNKSEKKYLVAAEPQRTELAEAAEAKKAKGKETVPVNFLAAHISVYFKIKEDDAGVHQYAFNYDDPQQALKELAEREIVNYLASADLIKIISVAYADTQEALEQRVRAAVEKLNQNPERALGLEVLYLSLVGAHPPVEVAKSFQNVITAEEQKRTTILEAERDAVAARNEAEGIEAREKADAEGYRFEKSTVPESEVLRFEAQLRNFQTAPQVFRMRVYLDMLEEVCQSKDLRKYVVTGKQAKRLTEIQYEEKALGLEALDTEQEE